MERIDRSEAKQRGLSRYFTGKPCSRGHIAERITASGSCHQCAMDDKREKRSAREGYRSRAEITAETNAPTRECTACHAVHPATVEFFVPLKRLRADGSEWTGLASECRPCRNLRYEPYYEANRERLIANAIASTRAIRATEPGKENNRRWAREAKRRKLADPVEREAHNARGRQWRKDNPERSKQFKHEQPAQKRYRTAVRIAREKQATPPWADLDRIRLIYEDADFLTRTSGEKYEVDHIHPLQHRKLCGLHVVWNLQIIPKAANAAKANRLPPDVDTFT